MIALWKSKLSELQHAIKGNTPWKIESFVAQIEALHMHQKPDLLWENASDESFAFLCQIQRYLMDCIAEIHGFEESETLKKYFENSLDIRDLNFSKQNGCRGHHIQIYELSTDPCFIIGDLHGDVVSLQAVMQQTECFNKLLEEKSTCKWIFLGDYVDRGKRQIEILERLMVLKILFPQNIFLQRGNHELGSICDGVLKLGIRKPETDPDSDYLLLLIDQWRIKRGLEAETLLHRYISFFDTLVICGFLKTPKGIFMLNHGGIARPTPIVEGADHKDVFNQLENLANLGDDTIIDALGDTIQHNILWSDPSEESVIIEDETRRFRFDQRHYHAYRDKIGFDVLIRGHQAFEEGVKYFFDEQVISVFSSGQNASASNDDTAYPLIKPQIIQIGKNSLLGMELG